MKPWEWIAATAVAAIIGLYYIHSFIYPRAEASKLERRVEILMQTHREDIKGIHQELKDLNAWLRENARHQNSK